MRRADLSFWGVAVLLLCLGGPAFAETPPPGLVRWEGPVAATLAKDGDLTLEDGRVVCLAGIEVARRPLGQHSLKLWPLAAQARQVLAALTDGPLMLYRGVSSADSDRFGRHLAQVFTADGRWVQAELLRQGLARVATTSDNRAAAAEMLAAETVARDARRGLWGERATQLRRADEMLRWIDSVQVVEGTVSSAAAVKGVIYLNFGEDWHRTLSARIAKPVAAQFARDPLTLSGHRLRVRGWVGKGIGPQIDISHPEQIEILDEALR